MIKHNLSNACNDKRIVANAPDLLLWEIMQELELEATADYVPPLLALAALTAISSIFCTYLMNAASNREVPRFIAAQQQVLVRNYDDIAGCPACLQHKLQVPMFVTCIQ